MATTATEKVIFVEEATTVHIIDGDVEKDENGKVIFEPHYSRVMLPGETLELAEVPSYLRAAVQEGTAPGLTLLTAARAKALVNKAERTKASVSDLVDRVEDEE